MTIRFMNSKEVEGVKRYVNGDPEFKLASRYLLTNMQLEVGKSRCLIKVREGHISEMLIDSPFADSYAFYVRGAEDAWKKLMQPVPPAFHNGLFAGLIRQVFQVGGNLEEFFSSVWAVTRMLDAFREFQNR